jgi:hypothetical protein
MARLAWVVGKWDDRNAALGHRMKLPGKTIDHRSPLILF